MNVIFKFLITVFPVNVAKSKTTAMSTASKKSSSSDKAVDGESDNDIAGGSCILTKKQNNPWFRVDLGKPTKVTFSKSTSLNLYICIAKIIFVHL